MRQSTRDKRNYVIVGLLLLVLFMTVGFAAFSTSLQINGTAGISTNWCVGFDNTKTSTYEITKGKSTGTTPSATMGYDGTACSSTYVPIANLGATFYQPGDKVEYTLTIANKGSVDAAIESITVDGASVTSNQTKQKGNIIWKVYMPEEVVLSANTGTTTMVVSAEFQNTTDLTNYTLNESQTITIGVNAIQGNEGMNITPAKFTGTIYRWNSDSVKIGDLIKDRVVYFITADGVYGHGPSGDYETFNDCEKVRNEEYHGYGECKQFDFKGIRSYTTDASTLNKTYYSKHTVVNDIITESYACLITDKEYCLQGGDNGQAYETNKNIIKSNEAWFNNNEVTCRFSDSRSYCSNVDLQMRPRASAESNGFVQTGSDSYNCYVREDSTAYCGGGSS